MAEKFESRPKGLMLREALDMKSGLVSYVGKGLCGGMMIEVTIMPHEQGAWKLLVRNSIWKSIPAAEEFGTNQGNATVFENFYCMKDSRGVVWLNPSNQFESVGGALG